MSEFKVGDKVRVLSNSGGAINNLEKREFITGDIDIITEIECFDSMRLGNGLANWISGSEIEKVTYTNIKQPKIKKKKEGIDMSEFKVGDKVRVIKKIDDDLSCEVGTIATVINVLSPSAHYGEPGFTIHIDWETDSDWVNKSEIEKITYTNVKQPKIKGLWTSATTSRVGLLILAAMLLVSLILGGLQSITSSILSVLTFIALVNDEMCRYEFKERKRYRKDVK